MALSLDKKLKKRLEKMLGETIVNVEIPPQGGTSEVLMLTTSTQRELVMKIHLSGKNGELTALKLLKQNRIEVPVAQIWHAFCRAGKEIILMEKIVWPLLESCSDADKEKYLASMVENLHRIHHIKSEQAGYVGALNVQEQWKDFLLKRFKGQKGNFAWKEIVMRSGLNEKLVKGALTELIHQLETTDLPTSDYVLLHTDFNQRNLFVDPAACQIAGIIDWGEAMFGDPLYDFARLKLLMDHFDFSEDARLEYDRLTHFSAAEKRRERIYLLTLIVEYLAYYSEDLNEFNLQRIEKHQNFLKAMGFGE